MPFKFAAECQNSRIQYLINEIREQQKLLYEIRQCLPQNLAAHTIHSILRDNKLILYTDAAVWSSQLLFYRGAIFKKIVPLKLVVKSMEVRVLNNS